MVKKRVLNPCSVLDEAVLVEALREEGIKEVSVPSSVKFVAHHGVRQLHYSSSTAIGFTTSRLILCRPLSSLYRDLRVHDGYGVLLLSRIDNVIVCILARGLFRPVRNLLSTLARHRKYDRPPTP